MNTLLFTAACIAFGGAASASIPESLTEQKKELYKSAAFAAVRAGCTYGTFISIFVGGELRQVYIHSLDEDCFEEMYPYALRVLQRQFGYTD